MTSQPQIENTIDLEEQYQVATYKKFPVVIESGQDGRGYTTSGDRYLDLYGGHAVVSNGYSHPRNVRAIRISLNSSYWLNRVVEWRMTAYAYIGQPNLLNAISIQFE